MGSSTRCFKTSAKGFSNPIDSVEELGCSGPPQPTGTILLEQLR
jgi:hypothetical protein